MKLNNYLPLGIALLLCGAVYAVDYTTETRDTEAKPDMTQWIKNTTPGENHTMLKDLVGTWKVTTKFWQDTTAKPEESKGTQTNKLIMGGRFLQSDHKGTAMGKPFTGMGLLGFDVVRGEYQSSWVDTMSTSLMTSTGTYDATTKTLSEVGSSSCPMTGAKNKSFRSEWKFADKKHYTYLMFTNGTDGMEFKALEINYAKN